MFYMFGHLNVFFQIVVMKGPEECCKEEDCGPVSLATEDFAEYFWMAEEMDEFDEKVNEGGL